MSEAAGAYYQARAQRLAIPQVPEILQGRPVRLEGELTVPALSKQFAQHVGPAEPYVLDGVLGVLRAQGERPTIEEWRALRSSERVYQVLTVGAFATRHVMPYITAQLPEQDGAVYLEALALEESKAWIVGATGNATIVRAPKQESAEAFFVTRVVDQEARTTAAYFTLVWGSPLFRRYLEYTNTSSTITPRYFGVRLARPQLGKLPALTL